MNIFARPRRIINLLRKRFPGSWRWDNRSRCWYGPNNSCARWCAALAPRYDGDDDSFVSELWLYGLGVPERIA